MLDKLTGTAYVVGDDVDTDQVIPAQYLAYNPSDPEERKYFGMYAMVGVPPAQAGLPAGNTPFVKDGQFKTEYTFIIGGRNFGCGSSREHAPLAIAEAGAKVVIAEFYARIFFRNCVNGGYLLPCETDERIIDHVSTGDVCEFNQSASTFRNNTTGKEFTLKPLGDVKPIIEAGGIFNYAKKHNMLPASAE